MVANSIDASLSDVHTGLVSRLGTSSHDLWHERTICIGIRTAWFDAARRALYVSSVAQVGLLDSTELLRVCQVDGSGSAIATLRTAATGISGPTYVEVSHDGTLATQQVDLTWLKLLRVEPVGRTVLTGLLNGANSLISEGNFDDLDRILRSVDVADATPQALVALARYTAPVSPRLPSWRGFVSKVRGHLATTLDDVNGLMVGLPA